MHGLRDHDTIPITRPSTIKGPPESPCNQLIKKRHFFEMRLIYVALPLAASRDSGTDVVGVDLGAVNVVALLVSVHENIDLLQILHDTATRLFKKLCLIEYGAAVKFNFYLRKTPTNNGCHRSCRGLFVLNGQTHWADQIVAEVE